MDQGRHNSLLGMAVMRGMLSPEALGQVALETRAEGAELLDAVVARGLLAPAALSSLSELIESHARTLGERSQGPVTQLGREVAAEAPRTADPDPGAVHAESSAESSELRMGRRVLDALRLASWKQYKNLVFLGEGGMGRIFRATDPLLNREVALKFLARAEPERIMRFVLEAQHQAMVEHPNICKVYEVGEWKGQSYIAMQLIRGVTLNEARADLTLAEKVGVMQVVAEAIHAAHRQGLIHRDLKPGNIMVERDGNGLKPYLLDFGLARGRESNGLTQVGVAVGTPGYMAPEQIQGRDQDLGSATDIYAMGATLYMLVVGEPPFVESTGLELMRRTVEEEPRPMASVQGDIARDLDTIVLKCMDKEPGRRYSSALALAEDLRRFLAGEPLQAAPPSLVDLVIRRLRRNRAMTAVVAASLLAVLALAGLVLRAQWRARVQASLAQRFGAETERMVGSYRWAQMLPVHDLSPSKAELRAWMGRIEGQMRTLGSVAWGPGHSALGRACLALGEPAPALAHLEAAWKAGNQDAEAAQNLGLAHAAVLREAMDEALRLPSRAAKEARLAELKRLHVDPALYFLRLSGGAQAPVLEGQIAFLEERFDQALGSARAALERDPWSLDASLLMGQAQVARARRLLDQGKYDPAGAAIAEALAAALRTEAAARSLADGYALEGEAHRLELEVAIDRGRPMDAPAQAYRAALDQVLAVDPESRDAHFKLSRLYRMWADAEADQGKDPEPHLEQAMAQSQEVLRRQPDDPLATLLMSMAFSVQADYRASHGRDPLPSLQKYLEYGKAAAALRPTDARTLNNYGGAFLSMGIYLGKHGQDPKAVLQGGLPVLENACRLDPAFWQPWVNRGIIYRRLASRVATEGGDPIPFLDQGQACYREAMKLNPRHVTIVCNFGIFCRFKAEMELRRGRDPQASLDEAAAALRRSLEVNPTFASAHAGLGEVASLRGTQSLLAGGRCQPAFQEAFGHFQRALSCNGNDSGIYQKLGRAWLAYGQCPAAQGGPGPAALDQARQAFEHAVRIDSASSDCQLDLARVLLLRGDLGGAARAAARARALDPDAADPRLVAAEIALRRAGSSEGMEREADLHSADADLAATERLEPWSPLREILRARFQLLRGGRAEAGASLRRALQSDRLLGLQYRGWLESGQPPYRQ